MCDRIYLFPPPKKNITVCGKNELGFWWAFCVCFFQVNLGWPVVPVTFFLHLLQKRLLGDKWCKFCTGQVPFLSPNQEHQSTELRAQTQTCENHSCWPHSFLIHHRTAEGRHVDIVFLCLSLTLVPISLEWAPRMGPGSVSKWVGVLTKRVSDKFMKHPLHFEARCHKR